MIIDRNCSCMNSGDRCYERLLFIHETCWSSNISSSLTSEFPWFWAPWKWHFRTRWLNEWKNYLLTTKCGENHLRMNVPLESVNLHFWKCTHRERKGPIKIHAKSPFPKKFLFKKRLQCFTADCLHCSVHRGGAIWCRITQPLSGWPAKVILENACLKLRPGRIAVSLLIVVYSEESRVMITQSKNQQS